MCEPTWTVVMPVKRLDAAKSRLRGALAGVPHPALVLALARDTLAAVLACAHVRQVLVVTGDTVVGAELQRLGARPVADPPTSGLNAAFAHGASLAAGEWVAALAADLPALRPTELCAALKTARDGPSGVRRFVADAPGTGTVLLAAPPGVPLDPRFGAGSAAAHAASGALPLTDAGPSLRRDVDTAADLWAAAALGLGRHTAALLHRMSPPAASFAVPTVGWPSPSATVARRAAGTGCSTRYGAGMQGTVATYDAQTRSGTLLLDDGSELAFPAAAFDASGLRLLRLGQRVRVEHDESGRMVRITLPTFD